MLLYAVKTIKVTKNTNSEIQKVQMKHWVEFVNKIASCCPFPVATQQFQYFQVLFVIHGGHRWRRRRNYGIIHYEERRETKLCFVASLCGAKYKIFYKKCSMYIFKYKQLFSSWWFSRGLICHTFGQAFSLPCLGRAWLCGWRSRWLVPRPLI